MPTVSYRGTPEQLQGELRQAVGAAAGGPDPKGEAAELLRAVGAEALRVVREAFVVKSKGGTDAAGIAWDRPSPRYVAYQRAGVVRPAAKAKQRRPLLTAAQDKRWRAIFASQHRRLGAGNAAALAWAVVKREGGKTVVGQYGNVPVEIGVRTRRLLDSLDEHSPECVLNVEGGSAAVGSAVPYAGHFHKRRKLWPDVWPQAWLDRLGQALADALARVLQKRLGG